MATATMPKLSEKIVVPAASSNYPNLTSTKYSHNGHGVQFSESLVRTGKDYYDTKRTEIPTAYRMSTAAEELAIQLAYEKTGQDPRKAAVFNDLLGRNDSQWYAWQWTETGLRVPKGRQADAYETDAQGRRYYPRIVLIGNNEVGEILVPEGGGRVVPKPSYPNNFDEVWDSVFGIPRVTSNSEGDTRYNNHTTHFWFNSTPDKDSKSGHYDVAVVRGGVWRRDEDEGCLDVLAGRGRWIAYSDDGFRPVQGSFPEIERELTRVDLQDSEESLLQRIRADYRSMPPPDFAAKYDL